MADLKLYNDQFYGGQVEALAQNIARIAALTRGAIQITANRVLGNYGYRSFFKDIDVDTRRDVSSTSDAAGIALTQDEFVSVKQHRKIGPLENKATEFRSMGKNDQEMSLVIGRMVGDKKLQTELNAGLIAAHAAIVNQSNLLLDATALTTKYTTGTNLIKALALMGDKAADIVCFVMHSQCYFDLMQGQADLTLDRVAGAVLVEGTPATLNRPVLVTDASCLATAAAGTSTSASGDDVAAYWDILGLKANAVRVDESEQDETVFEKVTGKENILYRFQSEYAINIGVDGFKWDVSNGGSNPTDSTLGTGSNWDKAVTNDKSLAGVACRVNAKS